MTEKTLQVKDQAGRELGPRALKTRQKWLDATSRLLETHSILEVTVAEIARQVGSVPSLFYHYFKDVESAALELAKDAAKEVPAMVELIDGSWSGDKGLAKARSLVAAYLAHWEKYHGVLLLRNHAADRGDQIFNRIRRDALEPLVEKFKDMIEESQCNGNLAKDIHPFIAASALVSILEKLSAYGRNSQRLHADREELIETCARMIYSAVMGRS